MSYRSMRERRGAFVPEGRGILIGAGLTLAFSALAALVASLIQSPALLLALSVLSFVMAGVLTLRLRPTAHPLDPAVGAGAAVLLFSLAQIALTPELRSEMGWGQIATSLVVSVLFAFSLAWLGAVIALRHRRTAPGSRRHHPSAAARESERMSRGMPDSRPAPHSG